MQPTTNRPIERRKFLSLAASASTLAASCAKSSGGFAGSVHPSWASERIRVGAIGVGGRGALLLEQIPESAQIVAAADCNEPRALAFREKVKGDWPVYSDYRKILDRNDIDAVIVADVEIGHRSISVCHLANITRELDRPLRWDPSNESFLGDPQANGLLTRQRRKGFELPA